LFHPDDAGRGLPFFGVFPEYAGTKAMKYLDIHLKCIQSRGHVGANNMDSTPLGSINIMPEVTNDDCIMSVAYGSL
jgi:hypothetical protein